MKKYALNLAKDGQILSVCECLKGQTYDNVVDSFPEGNISDYRYEDGEFIYNPLPEPAVEPTAEEDIMAMMIDHEERLLNLELGM